MGWDGLRGAKRALERGDAIGKGRVRKWFAEGMNEDAEGLDGKERVTNADTWWEGRARSSRLSSIHGAQCNRTN